MTFVIDKIGVQKNIAGPILATKYLSRNLLETLRSNSIALYVPKIAQALRLRFRDFMIIRFVVEVQIRFPRYL